MVPDVVGSGRVAGGEAVRRRGLRQVEALRRARSRQEIQPVIPPRRGASIRQHGNCAGSPLPRDEAIRGIRRLGRKRWKRQSGYHRRSLVETSMSRLKQAFGPRLKNKGFDNQQTEARLRCKLLNRFTQLGTAKIQMELGDKARTVLADWRAVTSGGYWPVQLEQPAELPRMKAKGGSAVMKIDGYEPTVVRYQ